MVPLSEIFSFEREHMKNLGIELRVILLRHHIWGGGLEDRLLNL